MKIYTTNVTFRANCDDLKNLDLLKDYYKKKKSWIIRKLLTEEAVKLKLIEEKNEMP